ncbi:unnamed protein product [Ilex paraguariensis]|uniref:Squalene monooxygenase n=1 Tax=Ilex paraguariensis TaxID=185542 RepID=A0ABC8RJN7_9AQUA
MILRLMIIEDGRRVLVIERDLSLQDRIVGELLPPGGYLKLIELDLEDCVNGIDAQRVLGYALFKDGKSTRLSYHLKGLHPDITGRSFHNGHFIQQMREKAATFPKQATVTSLIEKRGTGKGVQYKTASGQEMTTHAPLTIVCDGCFSNLRRSLYKPKVDIPPFFVALILKNCQLPYANHGHVILANPSPILLYPISSTEVRCLVDIPGQKVPSISNGDLASYLRTIVAPQCLNFVIMALGLLHMMIILFEDQLLLIPLQPVASTINTLAGALYKVFSASPDRARIELCQTCFEYPSLGGIFSNGPISLLSCLNPRPMSLELHFFAVAIYGVCSMLLPFPSPNRAWLGGRLISDASSIIFPIIKAEGVRQMFFPVTVPAYYRAPPTN